jgi:hypothetical protein
MIGLFLALQCLGVINSGFNEHLAKKAFNPLYLNSPL